MRRITVLIGVAILVAVAFALASPRLDRSASGPSDAPPPAAADIPVPRFEHPAYTAASQALRRRDCNAAQAALEPLFSPAPSPAPGADGTFPSDGAGPAAPSVPPAAATEEVVSSDAPAVERAAARIVSGLYAHACEDVALAAERLSEPAPGGFLDDWRLLLLAESAFAVGDGPTADRAFSALVREHPESPVWQRGLLRAVEQAAEAERPERVIELVRSSRERGTVSPEIVGRLEALAWKAAAELEDTPAREEARERAARRLLVHAPLAAADLEVVERFRERDGEIRWGRILTPAEIEGRADALLRADLPETALATLEEVAEEDRGLSWKVLAAEVLTRAKKASRALDLLDGVSADTSRDRAALAWERARAAADLSSPLRSGAPLSPDRRARMRRASHEHLAEVVRAGGDRELAEAALRRLFAEHVEDREFERALEPLRVLRRLDPNDTTGAGYLWNLGWEQYQRRNYTGAVGYWTELAALYPDSYETRSGRYWSGRAFEEMGNTPRALETYREVANAGSTDFYRKHALARLHGAAAPAGEPVPVLSASEAAVGAPWPDDPELARARLLTDLGLDDLALTEIEEIAASGRPDVISVDRRAREALTGLVLARQGHRRASIPHLRRAFPVLGGAYQTAAPPEALRLYYPVEFRDAVEEAAEASGVPTHLVFGIIREESAFDITALSHAGARGLMQLMPATGKEVAGRLGMPFSTDRLDDPGYNVRLGSSYFGRVLDMFEGRTELALAGYNGGPYRMKRLWREAGPRAELDYFTEALPIRESKNYVKRVTLFSNSYEEVYGF